MIYTIDLLDRYKELHDLIYEDYEARNLPYIREQQFDKWLFEPRETGDGEELDDFFDYWETEIEEMKDIKELDDDIGLSNGITLYKEGFEFRSMVNDLVNDVAGDIPNWVEIDWEATEDNVRSDYSECDYRGDTYFFIE